MKASICKKYGSPEVLEIRDVEKPFPKDDEVLIKVRASTVNRTDMGLLTGKPNFIRLFSGLTKPRFAITGTDFAGQVEATGKNVSVFKVGDRVMGFGGMGAQSHAEYMTFKTRKGILLIPENISYEVAAACMEGTYYALSGVQGLKPQAGQKAMVYGATGAIGSAMVQFLKYYGVYVAAVCSTEHVERVRTIGPDKIIDYKKLILLKMRSAMILL